ncbi:uncharacterized protein C9orf40 homolog [Protopterus annectens]|uniref:uncharacterized protein C9orf40 homolog n=1 Tax=Protopterus annectens TaxID=7888 RepID=UPI001CF99EAF|nr:uncharacterized protein C9orf40 homolog [Protopterus annectens]
MKRKAEVLTLESCKRVKVTGSLFPSNSPENADSLTFAVIRSRGCKRKFQSEGNDRSFQGDEVEQTQRGIAALPVKVEFKNPGKCIMTSSLSDNQGLQDQPLELSHGSEESSRIQRHVTVVDSASDESSMQDEEEFWQYNSFQYWRTPLVQVDFSEIEDFAAERMADVRMPDTVDNFGMDVED